MARSIENKNDRCFCGAEPIIFLPYASRYLCERDFIRMFDKRVRKTITRFRMLRKGDRVALGLSGGKDSTVLLHSLAELRKDLPFELIAITIDEGIVGYRPITIKTAKRECEKLGIEHRVVSFRKGAGNSLDSLIKKQAKRSVDRDDGEHHESPLPCSLCGVIRRYLLNKAAREAGATKLAMGHNLDDTAQTVFMNIMRNEPGRLARLNDPFVTDPHFIPRIRPLMLTPEKEIALYVMVRGMKIERLECPYARTAFRNQARKMLNETEERYPGTKFKVMNWFLDVEGALRAKYGKGLKSGATKLPSCPKCGEPSSGDGDCMYCRMVK